MNSRALRRAALIAALLLAPLACGKATTAEYAGAKRGHGPPPHAPAHGYRHKHDGVNLVFDAGRGVYVVVGFPAHYYWQGHYYRCQSTSRAWESAPDIKGAWTVVAVSKIPRGLRDEHPERSKDKDKRAKQAGGGHGPDESR